MLSKKIKYAKKFSLLDPCIPRHSMIKSTGPRADFTHKNVEIQCKGKPWNTAFYVNKRCHDRPRWTDTHNWKVRNQYYMVQRTLAARAGMAQGGRWEVQHQSVDYYDSAKVINLTSLQNLIWKDFSCFLCEEA